MRDYAGNAKVRGAIPDNFCNIGGCFITLSGKVFLMYGKMFFDIVPSRGKRPQDIIHENVRHKTDHCFPFFPVAHHPLTLVLYYYSLIIKYNYNMLDIY